MALILDGKALSKKIREEIRKEVESFTSKGFRPPSLAVILVGNDPASEIYVNNKRKACEKVGIKSIFYKLPEDVPEEKLLGLIYELNVNEEVDG
ncbi:MAG TPA: bifunctional methylenetetrahydrofolate dehydrogenase/methenyltetrahydrofolate cyclohydrolase, partial [Aquificaceae bacterium]|nr:bifunctional methylenetetrahydrofolate dehydrogenase/methenyltetrahydrofolate cyclohydrolase [Aquificaceae bacterium]